VKRIVLALAFVACGDDGGDDSDTATPTEEGDCTVVTVNVNVVDPEGAPEEGASVELENSAPCTEVGGGAYRCTATAAGEYHLTVRPTADVLLAVYTTLLTLPAPSCEPYPVSVQLVKSAI
jgi:hypothetical protein